MKNNRVTIRDVAREIGVSHQTVSRVINNRGEISEETRKLVQEAVSKLGYRPNASAQSLAAGRTNTIACISPNLTDYTFAAIIEGAELLARQNGYYLLSASAPSEKECASLINQLYESRRVDGFLIINPYIDQRASFVPHKFPTVFIGDDSKSKDIGWVDLDDIQVGYLATSHLLKYGHKKIACIKGLDNEACTQNRIAGYSKALREVNVPIKEEFIIQGDWTAASGFSAVKELITAGIDFSAIFAQNDRMAIGAISALKDSGFTIPDRISVIGVDDIPLAAYFDPPLTTIKQDLPLIGQESTRIIIKMINQGHKRIEGRKLSVKLVERQSTSKCSW